MKKALIILFLSTFFVSCDGSYYAKQIASINISDAQNLIIASPSATSSRAAIGNGESRKLYKETEDGAIQEVVYMDESGNVINPELFPVHIEKINGDYIALFYVQRESEVEAWSTDGSYYLNIDYAVFISNTESGHTWLLKGFDTYVETSTAFSIIPSNGFFQTGTDAIYFMRLFKYPVTERKATLSKLELSSNPTLSDLNVEWDEQTYSNVQFCVDGFDNVYYIDASSGLRTGHMGCIGINGLFDYQDVSNKNLGGLYAKRALNGLVYVTGYELDENTQSTYYLYEMSFNSIGKIEFIKTALPIEEYVMGYGMDIDSTSFLCSFYKQDSDNRFFTYNTIDHTFTEEIINLSAPSASWQTNLGYRKTIQCVEVINILGNVVGEIKAIDSGSNNLLVQLTEYYKLSDTKFRLRGKNVQNQYVIYDVIYESSTCQPAVLVETELFDPNTMDLVRLK